MYSTAIRFQFKTLAGVVAAFSLAFAVQNGWLCAQPAGGSQQQATNAPSSSEKKAADQSSESIAPENRGKEASKETEQAGANANKSMKALPEVLSKATGIPASYIEPLVAVIQQLTQSTRADQHSVYLFVKQVNRNLDILTDGVATNGDGKAGNCKLDCQPFKDRVLAKTAKLLESSYVDDLIQNKNLSHQIQLRMPLLIADSLLLYDTVDPEAAKAAAAAAAAAASESAAAAKQQKEQQRKEQQGKNQQGKKLPDKNLQETTAVENQAVDNNAVGSNPPDENPQDNPPGSNPPVRKPSNNRTEEGKNVLVPCAIEAGEPRRVTQWECAAWHRRMDFERDLNLLADRYLTSKRFRFGIGLSYSYIPPVSYTFTSVFDYSPYQQNVTSAVQSPTNRLSGSATFADATYPGLLLSAKLPYFRLDAILSNVQRTSTAVGPVWLNHVDPSANPPTDVLTRDTVTSKLRVYYDLSLKGQLFEILRGLKVPLSPTRFDVGVGAGVSGLRAEDSISTEIKKLTTGMTFNDLPPGTIVNRSSDTSFHPFFWNTDLTLKISDEFQVSLEGKWYHNKSSVTKAIYVNGGTLSVSVAWFPTLF